MLSIKFRSKKRVTLKEKIKIVDAIVDIIGIQERKEFFYSDYTFSKVEESISLDWTDDLLESDILDELDDNFFITLTASSPYGSIIAEIVPKVARRNVPNCSHIDINLEGDTTLYDIFRESKKLESLKQYLDLIKNKISEYYFFNLRKSPNCYSDIRNRLFTKIYDEFDFSNLLLIDYKFGNRLNEKTIKAIGFNFSDRIFQKKNQTFLHDLISENNLNVACNTGSLEFYGNDVPEFIDLVTEKLHEYINHIVKKDIYGKEFNVIFKK